MQNQSDKPVFVQWILGNSDRDIRQWLISTSKKKGLGLLTFIRMIVRERYEAETSDKK